MIEGWMNEIELKWLTEQAEQHDNIVEIGSFFGRSSLALALGLRPGSRLYCVDTWAGSPNEQEAHAQLKEKQGDYGAMRFYANLWPHIDAGWVIPIRMRSENAAELFSQLGIRFDMVFIDGEHTTEAVERDIRCYSKLLRPGGMISGHDIDWETVAAGVNKCACVYKRIERIWYVPGNVS